jgi:chlorobactene glucosyltransferase
MNLFLDLSLPVYLALLTASSYCALIGLPRLKMLPKEAGRSAQTVSIILPVKNEADTLMESLESLVGLEYPGKEIIAVYGESTDGTRQILDRFTGRIRILPETERPAGWVGKSWACHQGFLNSTGEILLFTDGDVTFVSEALSAAVSYLEQGDVDLLSCWPRMVTRAPSERVLLPVGIFMLSLGITTVATTKTARGKMVRGANGQFILIPRSAYSQIGGHESVKDAILEDGALGKRAVELGLNVVNASGDGLMQVKPYSNRQELDRAFERFGAGVIPSTRYLVAVGALLVTYFISPIVLLVAGLLAGSTEVVVAAVIGLSLVVAATSVFYWKYSQLRYLPSFPLAAILLTVDFARGFHIFKRRGVRWKDTLYNRKDTRSMVG